MGIELCAACSWNFGLFKAFKLEMSDIVAVTIKIHEITVTEVGRVFNSSISSATPFARLFGAGRSSSSAASVQSWLRLGISAFCPFTQATALSNQLRALSFSPSCQLARALRNQLKASLPSSSAVARSLAASDSVQCPTRYSARASVLYRLPFWDSSATALLA